MVVSNVVDERQMYRCGKNNVMPVPDSTGIKEMLNNKIIKPKAMVQIDNTDDEVILMYVFKKNKNR